MSGRDSMSPRSLPRTELERRVAEVVAEVGGSPVPSADADLSEFGFDSLALLDLLAALEERFRIDLTEDVVTEFRTIAEVARVVRDAEPVESRG